MQPQAREKAEKEGFEISIAKTSFKANTKALAENEGDGIAKVILLFLEVWLISTWLDCLYSFFASVQMIYRPDNGEILGVHIFGLHAADLIHEASNAIALGTRIQVRLQSFTWCAKQTGRAGWVMDQRGSGQMGHL